MTRAAQALPGGPPVDICLGIAARPEEPTLQRLRGIGGGAFYPNTILLLVAPSLNEEWLDDLPVTLAHEYHHLAVPVQAASSQRQT